MSVRWYTVISRTEVLLYCCYRGVETCDRQCDFADVRGGIYVKGTSLVRKHFLFSAEPSCTLDLFNSLTLIRCDSGDPSYTCRRAKFIIDRYPPDTLFIIKRRRRK